MTDSERQFKQELTAWKQQLAQIAAVMERIQRQQIVSSVVHPSMTTAGAGGDVSAIDESAVRDHDHVTGLFSATKTPSRGLFTAQPRATPSHDESKTIQQFSLALL
jgi:hypothetical protein